MFYGHHVAGPMRRRRAQVGLYTREPNRPWQIEITDSARLESALGTPLLMAFCRCFVHADRINSLTSFGALSNRGYPPHSVAHQRNLQTMFWFTAGTLLELRRALPDLESALVGAGVMSPRLPGWRVFRELKAWSKGPLLWKLRNKMVFHVDAGDVKAGVQSLLRSGDPWVYLTGDNDQMLTSQVQLGTEALWHGLKISQRDMSNLIRGAAKHQMRVPSALQILFSAVLRRRRVALQA